MVLAVLALAAAGCGDDDDSGDSSSGGGNPASGAPLEQAAAAMEKDDYDGAIKILEGLGNDPEAAKTLAKYKLIAAEETLQHAKSKSLRNAPQAAVSLTRSSLRYHPTPEARAYLPKAERAHDAFKARGQDDD